MAISDLRREYVRSSLDRADLSADPLAQFQKWFDEASDKRVGRLRRFAVNLYKAFQTLLNGSSAEPNVMALATADGTGQPSARIVLLKGADERGFTFFTNYESRKGRELNENPRASLVLYFADLERQICISGSVTRLTREESEAYFRSRPRGSQIAAWASDQSLVIADRHVLQEHVRKLETEFAGKDVPLPEFWGGYVLKPERIEFWQGRANRLHDRFCYTRGPENGWRLDRLAP